MRHDDSRHVSDKGRETLVAQFLQNAATHSVHPKWKPYSLYSCHDIALFGYSEHHPPLSVSYTQAAAPSGRKFLEEIVSAWPQYRERVSFIERIKEFLPPHRSGERNNFYVLEKV